MKNNKGITLIALTITIIVIIIIASVGTYSGVQALKDAKEEAQIAEVGMIQQAILENYTKYKTTGNIKYLVGTQIDYTIVEKVINDINRKASEAEIMLKISKSDYESLDFSIDNNKQYAYYELDKEHLVALGIQQEEETFIVNYSTGEVINKDLLVTRKGKPLYIYAKNITPE